MTGYRTTKDAVKADPAKFKLDAAPTAAKKPGFLGVSLGSTATGAAVVDDVEPDSPAEKCGLAKGDLVRSIAGQPARHRRRLPRLLRGPCRMPATPLTLIVVERKRQAEKTLSAVAQIDPASTLDSTATRVPTIGVDRRRPERKKERACRSCPRHGKAAPLRKARIKDGEVVLERRDSAGQPGENRLLTVISAFEKAGRNRPVTLSLAEIKTWK